MSEPTKGDRFKVSMSNNGNVVTCSTAQYDPCAFNGSMTYVMQPTVASLVGADQDPPMKWQNQHDFVLFLFLTGTLYLVALALALSADNQGKSNKPILRASIAILILAGVFTIAALGVAISMAMN